jgi:hypothetical protein
VGRRSRSAHEGTTVPPSYAVRRPCWSLAVSATVVVVLLLGVPSSASGTYSVRVTPPFAGMGVVLATTINTFGCHSVGGFVGPPRANATSGRIHLAEWSRSKYCGGPLDNAVTFATVGFEGPNFTVPGTGIYTVEFAWRLTYNVSLRAHDTSGTASAIASIFALGFLNDLTNGSVVPGGPADFPLFHEIHSGSWVGGNSSQRVFLETNLALTGGHLYQFETVLELSVNAEETGAGSAAASLNVASGGDQARLISLGVTG